MKKSLVLAMAMALGVTASAYAANPFSDVPAGHWAYDSISKLAAAGVIEGYGDATFGGDKLMTRYEMAQIVAKAMAKGANCDKLAAEFADELDNLGVRVANLEKKADNVKITGEVRYHYTQDDGDISNAYATKLRTRLTVSGQINDDWKYTGMLQNEQDLKNNAGDEKTTFQRAYVNGKVGGLAVQAGRYNLKVSEGNVYDNRFDGVQVAYGKDVKLTVGYGKADPAVEEKTWDEDTKTMKANAAKANEVIYAELAGKVAGLGLTAGYYDFKELGGKDGIDNNIWSLAANYGIAKDLTLGAMYLKGDSDKDAKHDDDGYVVTLAYKGAKASAPGSWGLTAKYYDQGCQTYVDHTMNGLADKMDGFKGYSVTANYAVAKNIVAQVEYYDLEAKENDKDNETLWAQMVFTF